MAFLFSFRCWSLSGHLSVFRCTSRLCLALEKKKEKKRVLGRGKVSAQKAETAVEKEMCFRRVYTLNVSSMMYVM